MCFTNVNEAGIRYRYFMYSTNKCTDFNKNITLYNIKKKKKKKKKSWEDKNVFTITKLNSFLYDIAWIKGVGAHFCQKKCDAYSALFMYFS